MVRKTTTHDTLELRGAELHKSDCIQANSYHNRHSTENEYSVPVWDVSFEELQDAYKIVAMTRNLDWHTEQILEEKSCIPLFKIPKKVGDFPRRITWLFVDDGKLIDLDFICHLTCYSFFFATRPIVAKSSNTLAHRISSRVDR